MINCPYCQKPAKWVENKEIYGRNYGRSYMAWYCRPCDAYVGCHNNTKKPLGRMADRELREWRKKAKNKFIEVKLNGNWKNKKLKSKAYLWLKDRLGKEFHFGDSTIDECKSVYELVCEESK